MIGTIRGHHLARLLGNWRPLPGRRRAAGYVALADAVRGLLADGRLPLGARLPAERELAAVLGVSRTTVASAYRLLRETGYLSSRRGAGSWTSLPANHRVAGSGVWTPRDESDLIELTQAAMPAPPQLAAAAAEAVEDLPRYAAGAGYHPAGIDELRQAVAERFSRRGVPTSADQILITSGAQQALNLVLRLLAPPGSPVLVESPTYPHSVPACTANRNRVLTHGLDPATGWDEELLLSALRQARPRLAYLIPEFQNPTGHLMPVRLRERVVAAAHAAGVDLVVDESFVDLQLEGGPLPPPVARFDRRAHVVTLGGMSKPFWGGLRIGWVRAAAPVVQRLAAVRVGLDLASPVLEQLVAARLLERAEEVVAARRAQLVTQRDALIAALREHAPQWRFRVPSGGLALWVELDAPVSSALARAVEPYGVRIAPGPRFGLDGTLERFLRLPYALPAARLVEAVRRLVAARYDVDRPGRRLAESTAALVA